jgi:hypothetical protein
VSRGGGARLLVGSALGYGITLLAGQAFPDGSPLLPVSLFLAAGLAIVIGLAAGVYPSLRASRLTPVEPSARGSRGSRQPGGGTPLLRRGDAQTLLAGTGRTSRGYVFAQTRPVVGSSEREGPAPFPPMSVPPTLSWTWRSPAVSTGRGGRESHCRSGSWSSPSSPTRV